VHDSELRKHLLELLAGGHAHVTFQDAVKGFPVEKAGIRPEGLPHSAWELLEHIRIALDDIARFSGVMDDRPRGRELPKSYVALKWPDDYWPKSPAPGDAKQWNRSVAAVEEGVAAFARVIEDPQRDLFKPFPWGDGQTLLREALLIADHSAYHVGQLSLVRRLIE
jgi:hypothetical protein